MERARSMRLHAGFPLQFWENDVVIVVYLINRVPSSSLDGVIPEEAWTGKKVNYPTCFRYLNDKRHFL
jgi:hypothetical protein